MLVVAACAIASVQLRTDGGALMLLIVGAGLPGFIYDRYRGKRGIVGGMVSGGLIISAYATAHSLYLDLSRPPPKVPGLRLPEELLNVFLKGLIAGVISGAISATFLALALNGIHQAWRLWQTLLTADQCGPMAWRVFENEPEWRIPPARNRLPRASMLLLMITVAALIYLLV
jgi:hypothetical protein